MKKTIRISLLLVVCGILSGCFVLTDGATRLAGEIGDAAGRFQRSSASSLEMKHQPRSWPSGFKGDYEIELQSSLGHPRSSSCLWVGDLDNEAYKSRGFNRGWGTTYHLNFVRVPHELRIRKKRGDTTIIVLQLAADGGIDITDLR